MQVVSRNPRSPRNYVTHNLEPLNPKPCTANLGFKAWDVKTLARLNDSACGGVSGTIEISRNRPKAWSIDTSQTRSIGYPLKCFYGFYSACTGQELSYRNMWKIHENTKQ